MCYYGGAGVARPCTYWAPRVHAIGCSVRVLNARGGGSHKSLCGRWRRHAWEAVRQETHRCHGMHEFAKEVVHECTGGCVEGGGIRDYL